MYRRAFTLIELLVVISIVALLSSVVLASLNSAREKARIGGAKYFATQIDHIAGDRAGGIWDFDENASLTAADRSNGSNGTLTGGAVWSSDTPLSNGYSIYFDGLDDYVNLGNPSSLNITDEVTVSAWIKSETAAGQHTVMSRGYAYMINAPYNGNIELYGNDGTNNTLCNITWNNAWNNTWKHIAVTIRSYTGSWTLKGYVDGKEACTATNSAFVGPRDTGEAAAIGKLGGGATRFFQGWIDGVRVYNKTLSASEIGKIYAEGLKNHRFADNVQ